MERGLISKQNKLLVAISDTKQTHILEFKHGNYTSKLLPHLRGYSINQLETTGVLSGPPPQIFSVQKVFGKLHLCLLSFAKSLICIVHPDDNKRI